MLPEATLAEPDLDFIVIGEGEETMCELVEAIRGGVHDFSTIRGLAWKDRGAPMVNETRPFSDLANAIFPLTRTNKRLFQIAAKTRHLSYYTTRGCPFRCAFCYNLVFNRRKWRQLPEVQLEEHLRRLRQEIDFDHIYMVDDYLGRRPDRLDGVATVMRRVGLTWHSSIRVNDINATTAQILGDGNCTLLLLGVESASEQVQQGVLVKDYRGGVDDVRSCVRTIAKTRITPLYSFMYNVPGETEADLESTTRLAEWIHAEDRRARIGFYAYTPYPGTPLYVRALAEGFVPPGRLADWGEMSLSNELNPRLRDLYFIAGLRFRGRRGDRTDENFPGWRRLKIAPFELASRVRWKLRKFVYSDFERGWVRSLIETASRRERGVDDIGSPPVPSARADPAPTPTTRPRSLPVIDG
jgi:anaerobic magnesium-protoporphyrin IX monomethyl ester cyclase